MRRVCAMLLALACGCSFTMSRPTRVPTDGNLRCSISEPIIDTVAAAFDIGVGVVFYETPHDPDRLVDNGTFFGRPLIAFGILHALGAVYGWYEYSRCRRLKSSSTHE